MSSPDCSDRWVESIASADWGELRPLSVADAPLYRRLYCNPQVMASIGEALTDAQAERSFHAALKLSAPGPLRYRHWTVWVPGEAEAIGIAALRRGRSFPSGAAELGVVLAPAWQGLGLGAKVLATVAQLAFSTLAITEVYGFQARPSPRVEAMLLGLGFIRVPAVAFAGAACACWLLRPEGLRQGSGLTR